MAPATEIAIVAPGLYFWQAYDPAVKADLSSSAVASPRGLFLIDPIPLEPEPLATLAAEHQIAGILITNENHERAASRFVDRFQVPVFAAHTTERASAELGCEPFSEARKLCPELTCIALPGAPTGETALHFSGNEGVLVIGDALINLEPYGFSLLPGKYCSNARLMRRSLDKLLDHSFERILFAHGTPIIAGARTRLEQLLTGKS